MKLQCNHANVFASVAVLALLGSCSLAPKYARPTVEAPAAYKEAGEWKVAQPRDDAKRGQWWEIFSDAELNLLVAQVDVSNQSVRLAEANFRQARALVQQARASLFPALTGNVSATRNQTAGTRTRAGTLGDTYVLGVDASYEVDIWGRVRDSVSASVSGAQASAADLETVRLLAQAELAFDYFQLRVLDQQRKLLDDTVVAFQKSLDLTHNRYTAGVAAKVDVVQAETLLKSTQAQAVDVGVQRAQLEHAIAILIGKAPAAFSLPAQDFITAVPGVPVSVPSELLERRPDIAAAERRVAAANARIGVAKSAFFPALTLSGVAGYQNSSFADWLSWPSRFWAVGPAIAQSIFDGGLRRGLTDQAIAVYDANVALYRQTVLSGFQEVEDNLAALRILEDEEKVQEQATTAARQSMDLTINQYKAGTVSYLNVAVVQSSWLNSERTLVGIRGRRLTAAVTLVKALGGGWNVAQLAAAK